MKSSPSPSLDVRPCLVLVAACALLGLSACGSRSAMDLAGAGGAGGSSAGGTGGDDTGGQSTPGPGTTGPGTGGQGGTGAGGGGEGGDFTCDLVKEGFDMWIFRPDGTEWGCGAGPGADQSDLDLTATVWESSSTTLVLDVCPPAADCDASHFTVQFDEPPTPVAIPPWTHVRLRARMGFWGPWSVCEHAISIVNVPVWDGDDNPTAGDDRLWLAAADGTDGTLDGSPFTIERVQLACELEDDGLCGLPGIFAMRFVPEDAPGSAVTVPMGGAESLTLPELDVVARNLRSYETGFCDDYWNWGYWVSPAWIK